MLSEEPSNVKIMYVGLTNTNDILVNNYREIPTLRLCAMDAVQFVSYGRIQFIPQKELKLDSAQLDAAIQLIKENTPDKIASYLL